jgi:hypothetical protein
LSLKVFDCWGYNIPVNFVFHSSDFVVQVQTLPGQLKIVLVGEVKLVEVLQSKKFFVFY